MDSMTSHYIDSICQKTVEKAWADEDGYKQDILKKSQKA